jgi:hypothetical protein
MPHEFGDGIQRCPVLNEPAGKSVAKSVKHHTLSGVGDPVVEAKLVDDALEGVRNPVALCSVLSRKNVFGSV